MVRSGQRPREAEKAMPRRGRLRMLRILFLVSAHNGLSQRALTALSALGHEVSVTVVDSAEAMEAVVRQREPELIVCPFLKTMIPESIWAKHRCLIVHPGPEGDRGPSSLDWAIELGMREWGVTVLEANGEADAGKVWATRNFPMRKVGKSSLYRHEVRHAAIAALRDAIDSIIEDRRPPADGGSESGGRARPLMTQAVRSIDWESDDTDTVIRKINAAEGYPGVLDEIDGTEFHLFGAHPERGLGAMEGPADRERASGGIQAVAGRPPGPDVTLGEIIATRTGAICRATVNGAVWVTHLKRRDAPGRSHFKLPAVRALALARHELEVSEIAVSLSPTPPCRDTYREIRYEERAGVGYLRFDFYNGAMSTEQCRRLRNAYAFARSRSNTKVIVLMGGSDYFSNGIHLNVIEAAEDPAAESWRNLRAINAVVREIIETGSHLVISALAGDAGAGGVPLALAADHVVANEDVVLNPYYQHMGGLYGSEYWTYLLPRRVGEQMTARLVNAPFTPIGAEEALRIGLLDAVVSSSLNSFHCELRDLAERLARDTTLERRLDQKRRRRARDENLKPLHAYGAEELARAHECFFGRDRSYHEARRRFVYKLGRRDEQTPRLDPADTVPSGSPLTHPAASARPFQLRAEPTRRAGCEARALTVDL